MPDKALSWQKEREREKEREDTEIVKICNTESTRDSERGDDFK